MTGRFPKVRADRKFGARIDQLLSRLALDKEGLAAVVADAQRMETHIGQHMVVAAPGRSGKIRGKRRDRK
jgi:hypothetical protein